ncbi:MAG: NlpC/P60 family protein [Anaerovoracaceae bacterium]
MMKDILHKLEKKHIAIGAIVIIAIGIIIALASTGRQNAYAAGNYWAVTIGDKDVVYLTSEEKANAVIKGVSDNYLSENSKVVSVSFQPQMIATEKKLSDEEELTEVMDVDDAIKYIVLGTKEPKTYVVKKGDTLWDIAIKNDFSVEELASMNKGKNIELIHVGDKIKLYEVKPFVNVSTTEVITSTKATKHDVEFKKTSDLMIGCTQVKTQGKKGAKKIVAEVVKENGQVIEKDIKKETVLEKPKTEVRLKGTRVVGTARAGETYNGSGTAIANYALQFVGNPYVYGGTSLTNGADCSGFVLSVYDHFGIDLCHDADAMRRYGVSVSLGGASLGDLVCYNGHVGIYVGGGRVVHAYNEGAGIVVSNAGILSIVDVRHIVD